MLFSELYKIMVNKVTLLGFSRRRSPQSPPLDLPLCPKDTWKNVQRWNWIS